MIYLNESGGKDTKILGGNFLGERRPIYTMKMNHDVSIDVPKAFEIER